MCEFTNDKNKKEALKFMMNQPKEVMMNPYTMSVFPNAYKKGHCPRCGEYLQHHERYPEGHATRSMCYSCYMDMIVENMGRNCLMCSGELPKSKIKEIKSNPREVREHMHEGPCKNLYTVIHNVAVGDPDVLTRVEQNLIAYDPQPQLSFTNAVQNSARNLNEFINSHRRKPVRVIRHN